MKIIEKDSIFASRTFIIAAIILQISSAQTCNPNVLLSNALKQTITFSYIDQNQQSYSYPYISRMFTSAPEVVVSVNQFNVTAIASQLNFYVHVNISSSMMVFSFNAPNVQWSVFQVSFWITSRADLLTGIIDFGTIGVNSNTSINVTLNSTLPLFSNSSQVTILTFIIALESSSLNSNFTVQVTSKSQAGQVVTFTANSGSATNVTDLGVCYVAYNINLSTFASGGGSAVYPNLYGNQFINIYKNIMPIYYQLFGISSLMLAGTNSNQFELQMQLTDDYVLNIYASAEIDSVGVVYLTIGQYPSSVCSPCNNFIFENTCVDTCPNNTYPMNYAAGGKACLICSANLYQTLNELSTACICLPGFQIIGSQCVNSSAIVNACTQPNTVMNGSQCSCAFGTYLINNVCGSCSAGQVLSGNICVNQSSATTTPTIPTTPTIQCFDINSKPSSDGTTCVCNIGFSMDFNGVCAVSCPANSAMNTFSGQCVCNTGLVNISGTCSTCPSSQTYDVTSQACQCPLNQYFNPIQNACLCFVNYYNISNVCQQCPTGTIYNGSACLPTSQNCSANQVLQNGICVCNSLSISLNNRCYLCSGGFYANQVTNLCQICSQNCASCTSLNSCQTCNAGYTWNLSSLTCQSINSAPTYSSIVQLKQNSPVYTTPGISTDFVINAQVPATTPYKISQSISLQFNSSNSLPNKIFFSQNPSQPNIYRTFFLYKGLLPTSAFTVLYIFNDPTLNLNQNTTITYGVNQSPSYLIP